MVGEWEMVERGRGWGRERGRKWGGGGAGEREGDGGEGVSKWEMVGKGLVGWRWWGRSE